MSNLGEIKGVKLNLSKDQTDKLESKVCFFILLFYYIFFPKKIAQIMTSKAQKWDGKAVAVMAAWQNGIYKQHVSI